MSEEVDVYAGCGEDNYIMIAGLPDRA